MEMPKENRKYMQEGIDVKRIFLLLKDKIWIAAAAAAAGALLGAAIYLVAYLVFAPEREYRSVSKLYLDFNCAPEDYSQLAYNGYTWNDLMETDPILSYTMEALPSEVDRETVIGATKAEILSDIRLLTLTITTGEPELTDKIMGATQASLVHLGETDELFHDIKVYSTTEPEQLLWDNRVVNAAVTGAVITLLLLLAALGFAYVLDDSVYVETDVEKRYGIPALGVFTASEPGNFQSFCSEFAANYGYLCREGSTIALLSVDCAGDAEKAEQTIARVMSAERPRERKTRIPMEMPENDSAVYERIRETDGAIVIIRYGRRNGKRVERILSGLEKQDCKIFGALIVEADEKFLKLYYRCRRNRR